MTSDWDEIRRLASDFQKIQLSSTLQRLSERNCIQVVSQLIEKGILDVIFTNDGKEYLTPQHLRKEIEDELYVHGGRINLTELAKILNVDHSHVDLIATNIVDESDCIYLSSRELLHKTYIEHIATEINEKLSQRGEISVSDLTDYYDLSSEFLLENVMEKYLGIIIHGRQDKIDARIFFTKNYVNRCKAKIRGALSALTQPTSVKSILQQITVQDRMFHTLVVEINPSGIVTSKQPGAMYIPNIYTKTQSDYVQSFFKTNLYLEYDSLIRLGVSDPKRFIKTQLPDENLIYLSKCCFDVSIVEQVKLSIDECILTNSYLDVRTFLPTNISNEDVNEILAKILEKMSSKQKQILVFGTTVLTIQYLDNLIKPCYDIINENAKQSVTGGEYQKYIAEKQLSSMKNIEAELLDSKTDRKDERRRKATGGKGGGGTQGRETKTKSTKKQYRATINKGRHSDSDEDDITENKKTSCNLELISIKEIQDILFKQMRFEALEDLVGQVARYYHTQLVKTALDIAHNIYESSLHNSTLNRRQTHAALQEKLNNLIVDVRLYEKGLRLLSTELQNQLVKYLLKSFCTDISNELCLYVASECNLNFSASNLTSEQRNKIAQECAQEYRMPLQFLIKTLNGSSIEEFLQAAEKALQSCSMILKKIDKKNDRTLILCHKHTLIKQLDDCSDPILVLHLCALVIFTKLTQSMLHASGKHVAAILSYLQPHVTPEESATLRSYYDMVLKSLNSKVDSDEAKESLGKLEEMMPVIKNIANNYKKPGVSSTE